MLTFARRHPWLVLFFGALFLRLIFVWQWQQLPYALSPYLDAKSYDDWAMAIAGGQWLRHTAFYQSPLYPYLLAPLYLAFGHSWLIVAVTQAIVGALAVTLLARATEIRFGRFAAVAAGLLAALDRQFIFYVAPVVKETWMLLTLSAFLYFVFSFTERGRKRDAIGAGVALGLTALLRGNALALVVCLPLLLRGWKTVALALGSVLLVILPATLHNYYVADDFVLMNSGGGFNLYVGSSPSASGANSYPPQVSTDPELEERDVLRVAEENLGRPLRPSEASRYWSNAALDFALDEPLAWAGLALRKIWFFWSNAEIPDNYDVNFITRNDATLLGAPLVSFGFVALFAALGLVAGRAWGLGLLTLVYLGTAVLFYVTDRYRLPALVFLIPLAGLGLRRGFELARAREWRPFLVMVPMAFLTFWPLPPELTVSEAYGWGLRAGLYSDAGRDEEAVASIQKALALDPGAITNSAFVRASTSQERMGNLFAAEDLLIKSTQAEPHQGLTYYNLARFYLEHGRPERAIPLFETALKVMPWLHQPYIGLGVLYYRSGKLDLAREAVTRGLRLNPGSLELLRLRELLNR